MNIKKVIRNMIAHCLYYTGVLSLLGKLRFKNRALVLMYHRVANDDDLARCPHQTGIRVSRSTFEKQMLYLRERFRILHLNDFMECIERKSAIGRNRCLLTFDDGWKDNYQNAYPILREMGLPAVIFLATDYVGTRAIFWQDKMAELIRQLRDAYRSGGSIRSGNWHELHATGLEPLMQADEGGFQTELSKYLSAMKKMNREDREALIQSVSGMTTEMSSRCTAEEAFMNWEEIKLMAENGISFGSHGKSHTILPTMANIDVEREVRESKSMIETMLGTSVECFCYPNGDYTEEVIETVKNAGYKAAFSTERGTHGEDDNPYRIRRINIHEDMTCNTPMFMARIVGLW